MRARHEAACGKGPQMAPESRKDQLLTQEVGDELVVYDERTNEAHRLNASAALVWRLADGQRSIEQIAAVVGETLHVEESHTLVQLALEELDKSGLLVQGLPAGSEAISRREMLTFAAALLPVAVSIVMPSPNKVGTPIIITPISSSSSSSSSATSPTTSSSSTAGINFTQFNGTWIGTGVSNTGTNTCNFDLTAELNAALNVDASGRGTWSKRHVRPNLTFAFNVQMAASGQNGGRLQATTSAVIGANTYTVTEDYTFVGRTATGTQRFERAGCFVVYQVSFSLP
jgi:hypothetical protein